MTMMRWDPFREMEALRRNVDRMFDDVLHWPRQALWENELSFAVDLYDEGDNVVLKAALPGVRPEDVDISISGNTITIKAESKAESETKQENYYRREIRYGSFARTATLPTRVDHDKAEATFKDGILTITMPKAEEVKPKSIKIKPTVEALGTSTQT